MLADSIGNKLAGADAPKLRTACENCRQSKVKCNLSGKNMCTRCLRNGLQCQYGFANRSGKPKGSKNRATLRKLGQLPEDKRPVQECRGIRLGPSAVEREPLVNTGFPTHITDATVTEDACLTTGLSNLWDSPGDLGVVNAEPHTCSSQMTAVSGSPLIDLLDACLPFSAGLGYPHTPVTPSFLPPDQLRDRMSSPPLSGTVSSPYTSLLSCECVGIQLYHLNRLNQLLGECQPLQFDQSLQTMKVTLSGGRSFLQCRICAKNSSNLLLLISVLNSTLQLSEYWVSRETSQPAQTDPRVDIKYGYYEVCHEESLRIRMFLLRGLLLQCRDLLSLLTVFVHASYLDLDGSDGAHATPRDTDDRSWSSPRSHCTSLPELEAEYSSTAGSESHCLLPIITGFEETVNALLQSVSTKECICGARSAAEPV